MRFQRCRMLFGDEDFEKLQHAKILILGVGGVGSYALDCLYRSGVSDITILDYDIYDETNQNRQIGSDAVGMIKVDRLKDLYPDIKCLFMSGYTANVIAHHGVLDEGVNFIQKPFTLAELSHKVRRLLEKPKHRYIEV